MPANLENSAVATGLEKVSFHSNPKERQCQRRLKLHTAQLHASHTLSKVRLKILHARLLQYVNCKIFHMLKLDVEKAEEQEIKLPTSFGSLKKQESSRKTPTSALLSTPKPFTKWITTNCGQFLKRQEYKTTWPASWEIHMQDKKQQLEMDMEQQTGSKLGKEYIKAVYCHPV